MSGTYHRSQIIDEVKAAVCRDRQNNYSPAENNFVWIAKYWTLWASGRGLLKDDAAFTAIDVAQMSALIKVARAQANPLYADNWVDQAGYAVCGGGIAALEREKGATNGQGSQAPEAGRNGQVSQEKERNMVACPSSASLFAARSGPEDRGRNGGYFTAGS